MPGIWTTEKILALAPDPASAKAGKELSTPRKWKTLGHSDASNAAWGECQGSGKDPYRTQIDLAEPAFKCSCPSRKFPCKHSLALFLLLDAQQGSFKQTEPPDWVGEWMKSRAGRAEKKAAKAAEPPKPVDPAAQAKRIAEREAKVAAGLADVHRWARDVVRRGFATIQQDGYAFFETPAARMIDAQAPGVARLVREMGTTVAAAAAGWQERLLEQLSRLHLLVEAHQRAATLPPPTQADVRALIGWTVHQDEVLARPGLRDRWQILGQRVEQEEQLRVQRTWLWGESTNRAALVLHFAAGNAPLDASLAPGTTIDTELVFFDSAYPQRAIIKQRHGAAADVTTMLGYPTLLAAMDAYAAALAQHPWLERFPVALPSVVPVRDGDGWVIRDDAGHAIPLSPAFALGWRLLALSGGHPIGVFGEWDGRHLLPFSAHHDGRLIQLCGKS